MQGGEEGERDKGEERAHMVCHPTIRMLEYSPQNRFNA